MTNAQDYALLAKALKETGCYKSDNSDVPLYKSSLNSAIYYIKIANVFIQNSKVAKAQGSYSDQQWG